MLKNSSVTVRISGELRSKLEVAAIGDRRSISFVINEILETWARQQASNGAPDKPRLVPPPGRPRTDATRAKALTNAGPLLPWIKQLIGDETERLTIPGLLYKAQKSANFEPAPGVEVALANALHGLGWTEWDEIHPDGTAERLWIR